MAENIGLKRVFRNYFLRGLAVLLPTILTIWILVWGYRFINDRISIHIKRGLVRLVIMAGASGTELEKLWIDTALSIAGFLVALFIVCIVGAFLASVVGKALWRRVEKFIMSAPFLRRVYPYVKQITDFVLTKEEQKKMFSRVVAVEYPRKGIWSIGFVTGSGLRKVRENVKKEFLTILIPNSPTPITGYVIMVPKEKTIALDMTVEEAFRFTVSGGVISPDAERVALQKGDLESED
ncbi:MAG: DUF502 domain-containing protein [Planctomycetota bacterium]|jgi:uncharacterized membrane protein